MTERLRAMAIVVVLSVGPACRAGPCTPLVLGHGTALPYVSMLPSQSGPNSGSPPGTANPVTQATSAPEAQNPASGERSPGPRELLALYGVDDNQFAILADRQPWQASEDEVLMKIFYRLPNLRLLDLERWSQPLDLEELVEKPAVHRGSVYRLSGLAVSVNELHLAAEMAERLGLNRYYRVEIKLDTGARAVVFARKVPNAWRNSAELPASAAALGFFLKLGEQVQGKPAAIFVAPRIQWYPESLLGRLGMDMGLLDEVMQEEITGGSKGAASGIDIRKLRLTAKDREAFYQMLAAVGRAEPGQLLREARRQPASSGPDAYSVVPLFNQPQTQVGKLVALSGTAKRIIPIPIDDADIRERLGIERYYEIYLFTDDSQGNPLVFCVRDLPPGMPTGEGSQFGEDMTIAGFFFKTWAYRRGSEESSAGVQWQLAPLLIGRDPLWAPATPAQLDPTTGVIAGGAFVLVMGGLALLVWLWGRSDRKARTFTIERQLAPQSGIALEQLSLDADGKPDFSGLAEMDKGHKSSDAR